VVAEPAVDATGKRDALGGKVEKPSEPGKKAKHKVAAETSLDALVKAAGANGKKNASHES
jgi:hypothetical protein